MLAANFALWLTRSQLESGRGRAQVALQTVAYERDANLKMYQDIVKETEEIYAVR